MAETTIRTRSNHKLALVSWLALCFSLAGISGTFIAPSVSLSTWYAALAKPSFDPPNLVFGLVWALFYTFMAIAAWVVWKSPRSRARTKGLVLFCVQLMLNFVWCYVFFVRHQIALALLGMLVLWAAILATAMEFFTVRIAAGLYMVPYFALVSFASVLNFAIWNLNGSILERFT